MATVISELKTIFSADTSMYSKGVKKASSNTKRFNKVIGSVNGKLVGMAAGLAGAAVAGLSFYKVIGDVKRQFEELDAIGKQADNFGISVELLQTLQTSAGLTGTSLGTLDAALTRFVRRLGEAKEGSGQAIKGFNQLGISVDDISNDSPDEAFLRIAESIKSIEDPTAKASAAYAFFGRQGIQLINLLNQGEEGILKVKQALEARGGLFSRKEIGQVEKANDAMLMMSKNWEAMTRRLAVAAAPAVEAIAAHFDNMAQSSSQSGENTKKLTQTVLVGLQLAEKAWIIVRSSINVVSISVTYLFKWLLEAVSWVIKKVNQVTGTGFSTQGIDNLIADTQGTINDINDDFDQLRDRFWETLETQIDEQNTPIAVINKQTEQGIALQEELQKKIEKQANTFKGFQDELLNRRIAAEESMMSDEEVRENRFLRSLYDRENGLTDDQRETILQDYEKTVQLETDLARWRNEIEEKKRKEEEARLAKEQKLEEEKKKREAEFSKMVDKAKGLRESLKTPIETATDKIKEIFNLRDKGFLSSDEAEELALRETSGLVESQDLSRLGDASALSLASSQKLTEKASLGVLKSQTIAKQQLNATKEQKSILEDIRESLQGETVSLFNLGL